MMQLEQLPGGSPRQVAAPNSRVRGDLPHNPWFTRRPTLILAKRSEHPANTHIERPARRWPFPPVRLGRGSGGVPFAMGAPNQDVGVSSPLLLRHSTTSITTWSHASSSPYVHG